jgi:hypothetical protein
MLDKSFWIWRKLKDKQEDFPAFHEDVDFNLAAALVTAAASDNIPDGDGKFSRIANYAAELEKEIEWVRRNWTGSDEELNGFLLGCDCIIIGLNKTIKNVKKGR